jgi:hypothetical protein
MNKKKGMSCVMMLLNCMTLLAKENPLNEAIALPDSELAKTALISFRQEQISPEDRKEKLKELLKEIQETRAVLEDSVTITGDSRDMTKLCLGPVGSIAAGYIGSVLYRRILDIDEANDQARERRRRDVLMYGPGFAQLDLKSDMLEWLGIACMGVFGLAGIYTAIQGWLCTAHMNKIAAARTIEILIEDELEYVIEKKD